MKIFNEDQDVDSTVLKDNDETVIKRTVLKGGLRVLSENIPTARSVVVACAVGVGARDENEQIAGSNFLLLNMLRQGSELRNQREIMTSIDAMGGELDGAAGPESSWLSIRVQPGELLKAVNILGEMITRPKLDGDGFVVEKSSLLELHSSMEDNYQYLAEEVFNKQVYDGTGLKNSILGSKESVQNLSSTEVQKWYSEKYQRQNTVVIGAGKIDHDSLVETVEKSFASWENTVSKPSLPRSWQDMNECFTYTKGVGVISRSKGQTQLIIGVPGINDTSEDKWAVRMLRVILGGGFSSRLFYQLREKHGLVYSVKTTAEIYSDAGSFYVAAGTTKEKSEKTVKVILESLDNILREGITQEELEHAKESISGRLALRSQSINTRAFDMEGAELGTGFLESTQEDIMSVKKLRREDVNNATEKLLTRPMSLSVVGQHNMEEVKGWL